MHNPLHPSLVQGRVQNHERWRRRRAPSLVRCPGFSSPLLCQWSCAHSVRPRKGSFCNPMWNCVAFTQSHGRTTWQSALPSDRTIQAAERQACCHHCVLRGPGRCARPSHTGGVGWNRTPQSEKTLTAGGGGTASTTSWILSKPCPLPPSLNTLSPSMEAERKRPAPISPSPITRRHA